MRLLIEKITNRIEKVVKLLQIEYELSTNGLDDGNLVVFIKNQYGGYAPFGLAFYLEKLDNYFVVSERWILTRQFVCGEKTDMYVLWSALMVFILKLMGIKAYTMYYEMLPGEIDGGNIIIPSRRYEITYESLANDENEIVNGLLNFIMSQHTFHFIVGDFSTQLVNGNEPSVYFKDLEVCTVIKRKEHLFEYDGKNVFHLYINNGVANFEKSLDKINYSHELKHFEKGAFICQRSEIFFDYKYISRKNNSVIQKIIRKNNFKDAKIICQENLLYVIEDNHLFIIYDDFSEYKYSFYRYEYLEKLKEMTTFLREEKFINLDWIYPIDPSRFEALIKDLLDNNTSFDVRLCGKAFNPDNGKDLIFKSFHEQEDGQKVVRWIGQCKAYNKTVNKAHVTDLRDRLEENAAEGFLLAVTEGISNPLNESIMKLEDAGYLTKVWTKQDIFSMLQEKVGIIKKYKDIIRVIEDI